MVWDIDQLKPLSATVVLYDIRENDKIFTLWFSLTTNGESSFEFYKKPAKKPLFVHHQSALPKRSKTNFIRNKRRRIQQRCSTQITSNKHDRDFDNILRLNGYPECTIDETKHPQKHQRDPKHRQKSGTTSKSHSSQTD